jgi:hypothetical protein
MSFHDHLSYFTADFHIWSDLQIRRFVRLKGFDTAYYAVAMFLLLASIRFFLAWCGVLHSVEPPGAALSMWALLSLYPARAARWRRVPAMSCSGLYLSKRRQ